MTTIIRKDTTWASGTVINLTSDLQIAHGATLVIEAGVEIHGNGHQILVAGRFIASGTSADRIAIDDAAFVFGSDHSTQGFIRLNQVDVTRGSFLSATGNASYGGFELLRSKFDTVGGFYIWYPTSASKISGSLFMNGAGLSIGLNGSGPLTITNNTFANTGHGSFSGGAMLQNWANYGNNLTVKGNNFFSLGQTIFNLPENYTSVGFNAEGNYFGTTNASTINTLILDGRDSITRTSIIDYAPFLSEPNSLAPRWTGPVAHWGTSGDDTFAIANTLDVIIEKPKQGIDTVEATASYGLPANVEDLTLLGKSNLAGYGNMVSNTMTGNSGKNLLEGYGGNDHIIGGASADTLVGGAGRDVLEGGTGLDKFVFRSGDFGGNTSVTADEITDFHQAERDRIDLSAVDAITSTATDNPFKFIGTAAFSGQAGELRYEQVGRNTYIQGDIDGNKAADFWIDLDGALTLTKADFIL